MGEDVVHLCNGILFNHKKEWNDAVCSSTDVLRDFHTKWRKSKKEMPYDITYMWNLKYNMGDLTKQKQTHRDNGLVAKGGRGWIGSLGLANVKYYICA